jgi:mannosyl-oligosaccharide alpha-1,2-mannosidase
MVDRLLPAFETPTGIPYALVDLLRFVGFLFVFKNKEFYFSGHSKNWNWAGGGCSILSELGTMHLEFQYLTQLTGKDIYLQKVKFVGFLF